MSKERRNRILAVDDDSVNIGVMKEIFTEGYELKLASSGEEALQTLSHYPADIILLDIMMPGMDGYEVCRRIRSDHSLNSTKIVFVSAKAMANERIEGYQCGADDYISKPFNEDELLAKVNAISKLDYKTEIDNVKRRVLMLFSHEMNTPLNAVLGYIQILKGSSPLDEKQKSYIQKIYQGAERLNEISKKALLLCDIKSRTELSMRPFMIDQLVNDIVQQLDFYSSRNYVTFSVNIDDQVKIDGDEDLMRQALTFVIENAIRFSPEHGVVKISSVIMDDSYVIRVEDQGKGIDSDKIDTIFDEFAVHDVEHHQRWQGLSLSMARHIARLHNGDLFALPGVEGGAKFMFWLPFLQT